MNGNENKNTVTGLDENIEALLAALVPLALTFVPHIKFLAWAAALAAAFTETKSGFVRLCAGQTFVAAFAMFLCSVITQVLGKFAHGLLIFPIAAVGIFLSLVQIACVVIIILIAADAYKMKVLEIPTITEQVKKAVKYE